MVSPFMPDAEKVAAIRDLLPATSAGIYLNAGSVGPMSRETAAAMADVAERELAVGRAHRDAWPATLERMDEARAGIAAILATDLERIALTHSTTEGINAILGALPWVRDDRVVLTSHEHPAVTGPVAGLRARVGVVPVIVDIAADADDSTIVADIAAAARNSRAVVVSHVLWTTGRVLPIRAIADAVRASGAWLLVDGAQAAGATRANPDELGVDAYALAGQKWLLGPEGTGALWVGDRGLHELVPATVGALSFAAIDRLAVGTFHPGARRFEVAGMQPASVVGLARACGWLSMFVGLPWAIERAAELARRTAAALAAIDGVELLTPVDRMATLVSFRVRGWTPDAVIEELEVRCFAIVRQVADVAAVRLSIGWWNTSAELDRVLDVIRLLAAHDPGALPPRRRLAVLGSDGRPID